MAMSTFSWLDIDDDESRKVREAISALDDKETLDPIGTGPIRINSSVNSRRRNAGPRAARTSS